MTVQGRIDADHPLLDAAQLALRAMHTQHRALLEVGCDWANGKPDRDTLAPELEPEVRELEAAIALTAAALDAAQNPPLPRERN